MSTLVFPTLSGLSWSVFKTPMWSTSTMKSVSGRELRLANYSYPIWKFKLSYEVLRAQPLFVELQSLMSFFNRVQGQFDTFLYSDPSDYTATAQYIGTGNGTTTTFQLMRTLGAFVEPVTAPDITHCTIYVNGSPVTATTSAATGLTTLASAPTAGQTVTWSGQFYFRCSFLDDYIDFENFMLDLWSAKSVQFKSVKL